MFKEKPIVSPRARLPLKEVVGRIAKSCHHAPLMRKAYLFEDGPQPLSRTQQPVAGDISGNMLASYFPTSRRVGSGKSDALIPESLAS
jgi:hypothetical protein